MSFALGMKGSRALLPALVVLVVAGCSGPMVPPEDIDGETRVSSIPPAKIREDVNYAAQPEPAQVADDQIDYLNTPNLAAVDPKPEATEAAPSLADPSPAEDGVNIDSALGVEPEPVGLAEEQANDIAEKNTSQPVVDGIGTDTPVALNPAAEPASKSTPGEFGTIASEITPPSRRVDRSKETEVAFIPRFSNPEQIPESYGGLTAADRSCRAELKKLGVKFREIDPIADGANCGIPHPIEVSGFSGGITLKPAAKLNCNITRSFAKWVKYELVPSSRYRYFSGIDTIYQMSSYSCRKMNSKSSNPWSEHAKGNAIDIGKFVLKSGKEIDVRKKSIFAFREKGLLKAVRSDSCKYFNTVLGPGSDPHHKDHFHFDLRTRKSGYRHCD
ncbi:extensin-like domain-containing protein [Rhizobium alvei]|uniref:Extensin family protein n=1 Tax=Rhizobium alvei TaxID=1132659 RepID=A0ABT8YJL8_9HYPH|nr:extensin family protein [Rhizobium alvei]MDO6963898.1 extensin family protein [Rhizobium alvei]